MSESGHCCFWIALAFISRITDIRIYCGWEMKPGCGSCRPSRTATALPRVAARTHHIARPPQTRPVSEYGC
eukprot:scaffold11662_cov117-Cylindrotheca_fusiformis.AAC.3